jgi:guanylate kinase
MIILTGESAAGKTSCERELERRGYKRIISYTTRPIRGNEQEDIDYHYIDPNQFIEWLSKGFFSENTKYRGWFYGIAKKDCIDNAIAVVEPVGFRKLQKINDLHIESFYLKTSERTRMIRMAQRGDDINEIIRRLYSDQGSFACIEEEIDYVVVNENRTVEETVDEIINILTKS